MSSRPDPLMLLLKAVLIAAAGWLFLIVLRMETGPATPEDKRETVLRKIMHAAQGLRFQSPYTKEQIQQRVKAYTGK